MSGKPRLPKPAPPEAVSSVAPVIALCVTGSIAAYKAAEVARALVRQGATVMPVMTPSAMQFLGAMTLSGITGHPVRSQMFDPSVPGEVHVDLASAASVVAIVPATADVLARLAEGRADDLVTALALSARGPIVCAPAMHPRMWAHPATQRNVATLASDGRVELVGPIDGEVASGELGIGRMAEPDAIAAAILARTVPRDLAGLRILVSAGPTVEDIDPVRYVSNRSTGKMGFAIAARASARGADVTLVAGPVALETPFGVERVDVRSAVAMRSALWERLGTRLEGADVLIMTAAVSDYRPSEERTKKVKREAKPMSLEMIPNPDLLAEIGAARTGARPILIGFAVETDSDDRIVLAARGKLETKRVDLVVANHADEAFAREDNRATLVDAAGAEALEVMSKKALADRILDRAADLSRR